MFLWKEFGWRYHEKFTKHIYFQGEEKYSFLGTYEGSTDQNPNVIKRVKIYFVDLFPGPMSNHFYKYYVEGLLDIPSAFEFRNPVATRGRAPDWIRFQNFSRQSVQKRP